MVSDERMNGRAFTLVEVAIALFVVAVGFTAVLAAFPTGAKLARASAAQAIGSRLAETYFNEIRAQFSHLPPTGGTPPSNADANAWSSPRQFTTDDTVADWFEHDVPGFDSRSLRNYTEVHRFLNHDVGGRKAFLTADLGGSSAPYLRRSRIYENSAAVVSGGIRFPERWTAGGFYLCAAANITTLFPNHNNMSNVIGTSQFTNDTFCTLPPEEQQALTSDATDLRLGAFRLYDVYIYVFDSNPENKTRKELEKSLVTTYQGRAWLGFQPPPVP